MGGDSETLTGVSVAARRLRTPVVDLFRKPAVIGGFFINLQNINLYFPKIKFGISKIMYIFVYG